MSQPQNELLEKVLALPKEQRAEFVEAVMESLEQLSPEEAERLWAEEGERRLRAFREGKMQALPGPETVAKLRAQLKA